MDDKDYDEYVTTASAIVNLAFKAEEAAQNKNHNTAVMVFNLLQQFSKAAMLTAHVHASNDLKKAVLPEEYLTEERSPDAHPLMDDPGQYL